MNLLQLFNRFLVYRGARFVAAARHPDRPATSCFRIAGLAGPWISLVPLPSHHGVDLFQLCSVSRT